MAETRLAIRVAMEGLSTVTDGFQRLQRGLGALGLAVSTGALIAYQKAVINTADQTSKLAQTFGTTTSALSLFHYSAKLTFDSVEEFDRGLKQFTSVASDASRGVAEAVRPFQRLGVSVTDASGQLRPLTELMPEVMDAFARLPDGVEKSALASDLFGRSLKWIPYLNQGSEGLKKMQAEARALGLQISTGTGKAAEDFNDNLTRLKSAGEGLALSVASKVLPGLVALTGVMVDIATKGGNVEAAAQGIAIAFRAVAKGATNIGVAYGTVMDGIAAQSVALVEILKGNFAVAGQAMKDLYRRLDERMATAAKLRDAFDGKGTSQTEGTDNKSTSSKASGLSPLANSNPAEIKATEDLAAALNKSYLEIFKRREALARQDYEFTRQQINNTIRDDEERAVALAQNEQVLQERLRQIRADGAAAWQKFSEAADKRQAALKDAQAQREIDNVQALYRAQAISVDQFVSRQVAAIQTAAHFQEQALETQLKGRQKLLSTITDPQEKNETLAGIEDLESQIEILRAQTEQRVTAITREGEDQRRQIIAQGLQDELDHSQLRLQLLQSRLSIIRTLNREEGGTGLTRAQKEEKLTLLKKEEAALREQVRLLRSKIELTDDPKLRETYARAASVAEGHLAQNLGEQNQTRREPAKDSIKEQFEDTFHKLNDEIGHVAIGIAHLFRNVIGSAVSSLQQGIAGLISGTMSWGQALNTIATSFVTGIINAFAQMVSEFLVSHVLMRGIMALTAAFGFSLKAKDVATTNAAEAAKTPALATNAGLASASSWGVAAAVGIAVLIGAIAALSGAFAEGGLIPGAPSNRDNRIAAVASGEYIVRAAAVSHYGPELFKLLNDRALPAGVANSPALAFAAGGLVPGGGASAPLDMGKWIASLGGATPQVSLANLSLSAPVVAAPMIDSFDLPRNDGGTAQTPVPKQVNHFRPKFFIHVHDDAGRMLSLIKKNPEAEHIIVDLVRRNRDKIV